MCWKRCQVWSLFKIEYQYSSISIYLNQIVHAWERGLIHHVPLLKYSWWIFAQKLKLIELIYIISTVFSMPTKKVNKNMNRNLNALWANVILSVGVRLFCLIWEWWVASCHWWRPQSTNKHTKRANLVRFQQCHNRFSIQHRFNLDFSLLLLPIMVISLR